MIASLTLVQLDQAVKCHKLAAIHAVVPKTTLILVLSDLFKALARVLNLRAFVPA